ncbi:hypothetical protein CROQUDRAFT_665812 [Cronartium quercuum f. sp. fusiforme G11]|uniref:Dolichyl-diphosphooligosaccharide-protein glycosyltransferase subunit OST5 n=1 Tax=Cronartium quercuum f. sp. fusiforme G11 TaxID=708437 RepID=A0A9P6N6S3_9BASI|nr:hypothetical protein CROQUDRAFT_665812 [Cronartium quercuum f. sp. fusiforme G11]
MAEEYSKIKDLFESSPAFLPTLSPQLHSTIGFGLLFTAFGVGFTFTTLPKQGLAIAEIFLALVSSLLTGFGVVFLFNAAGVHV